MQLTTHEVNEIMIPSAAKEYWGPLSVQVVTKDNVTTKLTTSTSMQKPLSGLGHVVQVPPKGIYIQIAWKGLYVSPNFIDLFWTKDTGKTLHKTLNTTKCIFVSTARIEKHWSHLRIRCAFANAPLDLSKAIAVLMVNHKRLGANSPLASIFSNMDIQNTVLSYLKYSLIDYSTLFLDWPFTFQTGTTLKVWSQQETFTLEMEEESDDEVHGALEAKRPK